MVVLKSDVLLQQRDARRPPVPFLLRPPGSMGLPQAPPLGVSFVERNGYAVDPSAALHFATISVMSSYCS